MERYYFHVEDGRVEQDTEGTELPGKDAAYSEAVGMMWHTLRDRPEKLNESDGVLTRVQTAAGLTLLTIHTCVTYAPSFSRPQR